MKIVLLKNVHSLEVGATLYKEPYYKSVLFVELLTHHVAIEYGRGRPHLWEGDDREWIDLDHVKSWTFGSHA